MYDALAIVRPDTVIRWHRAGFRSYWRGPGTTGGNQGRARSQLEFRAAVEDGLQAHQTVVMLPGVIPTLSNDAECGPTFAVNDEDACHRRAGRAIGWAGLANTFYWIDRKNGFGGYWAPQILPIRRSFPSAVWFRSAAIWTSTAEWRGLLAPSQFLALRASSLPEMQQDAQRGQAFLLSNFWHYVWFLNMEKSRGDGDSKVVQSDEGVWVHSAGCRRQGRLRSYISR